MKRTKFKYGLLVFLTMFFIQCNKKAVVINSKAKQQIASEKSNKVAVKNYRGENFDKFYTKFHKDSLFQLSRVKFPLKGSQVNAHGTTNWSKEKWLMIKAKASEVDKKLYNVKTSFKGDSYFEGVYCKDCPFTFEMEYKLVNGKWFLVYLQENDL